MENTIEKQKVTNIVNILKIVYIVVPIAAGLDKFTNLLVHWNIYINPLLLKLLPVSGQTFMYAVGIIEIAAGIIVFANPRVGSYIVSAWLACISLSLLISASYLDVAVRDLVMSAGAFTLARFSALIGEVKLKNEKVIFSTNL